MFSSLSSAQIARRRLASSQAITALAEDMVAQDLPATGSDLEFLSFEGDSDRGLPRFRASSWILVDSSGVASAVLPGHFASRRVVQSDAAGNELSDDVVMLSVVSTALGGRGSPCRLVTSDSVSHITLSDDGLTASYTGPGRTDSDAFSVRSNAPLSCAAGMGYFEMTVRDDPCHIYHHVKCRCVFLCMRCVL